MVTLLTSTINFFFLLTPFFVLSLFLEICKNKDEKESKAIVWKTTFYILFICLFILFFGQTVFKMMGITLIAFQIGSGLILLLSGISMMKDKEIKTRPLLNNSDPSLIPLTLPITVGPGTLGALFVLGAKLSFNIETVMIVAGICIAVFLIWCLLYFSKYIYKLIGDNGLDILSKLTGLFLSIIAVQSILNGITSFVIGF
jgi:multiple antibiotic resistance protein